MQSKLGIKHETINDLGFGPAIKKRELISRFFIFRTDVTSHVYYGNLHFFHYAALHSTAYLL